MLQRHHRPTRQLANRRRIDACRASGLIAASAARAKKESVSEAFALRARWQEGDLEFEVSLVHPLEPFRFGNGGIQMSESYVLVPQRLGDELVMLGIHNIDAPNVPIFVGMKALEKLGAIIDVEGRAMVLGMSHLP